MDVRMCRIMCILAHLGSTCSIIVQFTGTLTYAYISLATTPGFYQ